MTFAEARIKAATYALFYFGRYPSAGNVQRLMSRRVTHTLNGRDLRWRNEELRRIGYRYHPNGLPAWTLTP